MSGKSKILQQKDLERFCSFDQNGHKITIKQIYDTPFDKVDKRRTDHYSLYVTCIESILLNFFIRENETVYKFTKKKLWEELGMISTNYYSNYKKKDLVDSLQLIDNRVQQWHINNFYSRSRKKLDEIMMSALKSLSNRKLIDYRLITVAKTTSGKFIEVEDAKDREIIMQCEKMALEKLGCKSMKDVYFPQRIKFESSNNDVVTVTQKGVLKANSPGHARITVIVDNKKKLEYSVKVKGQQEDNSDYNKKMVVINGIELQVGQEYKLRPDIKLQDDQKVRYEKYIKLRNNFLKTALDFEYVFKEYEIVCNTKYLKQGLQENEYELKHELNSKIIKNLDDQAKNEFNKNQDKYNKGETNFQYPNYFNEIQHLLVTRLLKLDEEQLQIFINNLKWNPELDELSARADEIFKSKSA